MKFKSDHMIAQYQIIPDKLKEICGIFDGLSTDNKIEAIVTRVSDPVQGESGVHLEHRAVDFRNQYSDGKSLRCLYSMELVEEITDHINNMFPRKDKFETILHHSFQGGLFHFHIQLAASDMTPIDVSRITNAK